MNPLNTIKTFEFDSAYYRLDDGHGDQVSLAIDYKNNRYSITSVARAATIRPNPAFRRHIAIIAADLLARKHGQNFASKFTS